MVRNAMQGDSQFDYPVKLGENHRAVESTDYTGDRLECDNNEAYDHTGAWPTYSYCPWCGEAIGVEE